MILTEDDCSISRFHSLFSLLFFSTQLNNLTTISYIFIFFFFQKQDTNVTKNVYPTHRLIVELVKVNYDEQSIMLIYKMRLVNFKKNREEIILTNIFLFEILIANSSPLLRKYPFGRMYFRNISNSNKKNNVYLLKIFFHGIRQVRHHRRQFQYQVHRHQIHKPQLIRLIHRFASVNRFILVRIRSIDLFFFLLLHV